MRVVQIASLRETRGGPSGSTGVVRSPGAPGRSCGEGLCLVPAAPAQTSRIKLIAQKGLSVFCMYAQAGSSSPRQSCQPRTRRLGCLGPATSQAGFSDSGHSGCRRAGQPLLAINQKHFPAGKGMDGTHGMLVDIYVTVYF